MTTRLTVSCRVRCWADLYCNAIEHFLGGHTTLSNDERHHVGERVSRCARTLRQPAVDASSYERSQSNFCSVHSANPEMTQPAGVLLCARDRLQQTGSQRTVADTV